MKRTNSANILRMLGVRSWIFETHLRRLDEVTGIECGTSETEAHWTRALCKADNPICPAHPSDDLTINLYEKQGPSYSLYFWNLADLS